MTYGTNGNVLVLNHGAVVELVINNFVSKFTFDRVPRELVSEAQPVFAGALR